MSSFLRKVDKSGVNGISVLALLIPLSYTIVCRTPRSYSKLLTLENMRQGARYNIRNEVVIGALLLPGGLGSARESTHRSFVMGDY